MNNKQIKRQLWTTAGLGLVVLVIGAVALYNYFDGILREFFFR